MEQILLAYDIPPKKTVAATMMLYKNVIAIISSLDGKQILEVAPYKTAAVRPLASHLTNHPN